MIYVSKFTNKAYPKEGRQISSRSIYVDLERDYTLVGSDAIYDHYELKQELRTAVSNNKAQILYR